jgi:mono/diheme cytochrome c family protein
MANGSTLVAMTCATCHVSADAGALRIGAPNARLDLGRLALDALGDDGSALSTNMRAWGPGRVDVSTQDGSQPARIPDVRPTRFLTHLHQEATLEQRDVATLAIRIETLILTSHGQVLRPPRPVAVGLALYVWSLADALPAPSTSSRTPGASLFQEDCATCHHSEGFTGAPIPLDEIGTDPKLGRSTERGTGMYRVPSLRGVGSRGPLLHDASLPSVEALLDPSRTSAGYAGGRAPGPVPGHTYGLTRTAEERAALAAFVKGL